MRPEYQEKSNNWKTLLIART